MSEAETIPRQPTCLRIFFLCRGDWQRSKTYTRLLHKSSSKKRLKRVWRTRKELLKRQGFRILEQGFRIPLQFVVRYSDEDGAEDLVEALIAAKEESKQCRDHPEFVGRQAAFPIWCYLIHAVSSWLRLILCETSQQIGWTSSSFICRGCASFWCSTKNVRSLSQASCALSLYHARQGLINFMGLTMQGTSGRMEVSFWRRIMKPQNQIPHRVMMTVQLPVKCHGPIVVFFMPW